MNAPSKAAHASADDGQEARRQRFSPDPSDEESQSELSSDSSCRLASDKRTNKSSRLESKLSKVPTARLPSLMQAQQIKVEAEQRANQKSALDSQRGEEEKKGKSMDSEERRNAFRTFWLAAVTEEFGEELENMRKRDPSLSESLGGSRLPLLIDALASGSELFSTGQPQSTAHLEGDNALMDVDEVGMLLNNIE
ncbi:Ribosome-assembly protein 3 [Ceraceosorus bombacis]|uniref:Ribosome assembly protein 3 n=1 Tax=Ceraceosorus bombacis TaxID=401625 RepID=A0A0N7L9F9_9BASI|nr:Ribosome-assembly protein 3 [Ceraceosorus bombacis]